MVDDLIHKMRGQIVRDVMRIVLYQGQGAQTGPQGLAGMAEEEQRAFLQKDVAGIVSVRHPQAKETAKRLVRLFEDFQGRPVQHAYPIYETPAIPEERNTLFSPHFASQERPKYVLDAALASCIAGELRLTVARIVAAQSVFARTLVGAVGPSPPPQPTTGPAQPPQQAWTRDCLEQQGSWDNGKFSSTHSTGLRLCEIKEVFCGPAPKETVFKTWDTCLKRQRCWLLGKCY